MDPFHQAQLRLQSAGCRYRIKQVARSPYVQVYDTRPPRRQQSARGYRSSVEQACWHLVEVLLQADKEADAGRPGLDWDRLAMGPVAGGPRPSSPTWGDVLDALRPPRQPGQKLWDWRRETTPQPVVFKDPQEVNADRVHLHLEHPLVQRLLNRFLVRGFQTDELSRAAVISTADDTAKLILLARLSLYGHGAARLHDEVIELVAEWDPADPARRLRLLNATKTDMALADLEASLQQRLPPASPAVEQQLRQGLPADVAQLKERLGPRPFPWCKTRGPNALIRG